MSDDLRVAVAALLDAVSAARPRIRTIPAHLYTPAPTTADPNPVPWMIPETTQVYADPTMLPAVLLGPTGDVDLGAQVAFLQGALAQLWTDLQIRNTDASLTVTDGRTWGAGLSFDIALTWAPVPARVPTSVVPFVDFGAATQLGRLAVAVKPGTVTAAGVTVTLTNISAVALIPSGPSPVTIRAIGQYFYIPPYVP